MDSATKRRTQKLKTSKSLTSIVNKIFGSRDVIKLKKGFLYFPTLLDSQVKKEITDSEKNYLDHQEKGFNIKDFISNFYVLFPEVYENIKKEVLKKATKEEQKYSIPKELKIVLEVMPHFVTIEESSSKIANLLQGKKTENLTPEEKVLNYIQKEIKISKTYIDKAANYFPSIEKDLEEVETKIAALENEMKLFDKDSELEKKLFTKLILTGLIQDIFLKEKTELEKMDAKKNMPHFKLLKQNQKLLATKIMLSEKSSFEIKNFGFRKYGGYNIYVKLDEYALMDFDGQVYLFPPCKIGVKIYENEIKRPRVMNEYWHPFLSGTGSDQSICIRGGGCLSMPNSKSVIKNLQKGIDTILYGYFNKSGFNGYFLLSGRDRHGDYRTSRFEPYKVSEDKVKDGFVIKNRKKIPITNYHLIKKHVK